MTCLSKIAEGAAFDVTEAVRAIAKYLTLHDTTAADRAGDLDLLLDARLAAILRRAGLETPEQVRRAPDAYLLSLDGIGARSLARIRAQLAAPADEKPRAVATDLQQLGFDQLNEEAGP